MIRVEYYNTLKLNLSNFNNIVYFLQQRDIVMAAITVGKRQILSDKLARVLRQRVRTGQYPAGSPLPPVRKLSQEFGVSLNVVQRAVRNLEQAGILVAHHGRGIMVQTDAPCQRTAILFAAIHPYSKDHMFGSFLAEYIHDTLAKRSNFAVVQSSLDDAATEKRLAEHLVANGAQGLIVWPVTNDPNGEYFTELSHEVPVVLVDRLLPGANLPAVLLDYAACGSDVSKTLLGRLNCKRLLVLMDDLWISSYQDLIFGIESAGRELKRRQDITIVQLPISRHIVQPMGKEDYSNIPEYAQYVDRLLREGNYDAVFCTQDEFVDYVIAQTHLFETCRSLRIATLRSGMPNERSIKYLQLGCLEWSSRTGDLLATAAELVQQWVLARHKPTGVIRIAMEKIKK